MPKISVIVPVYNTEKYLAKCLDGLVQQTFRDIEIICVDDGSTDKSLEILNYYAASDSRIKVHSQENKGVAAARNTALKLASGEWIAFCDSDDTVPIDAYEKLLQNSDCVDVVIGNFRELDDFGYDEPILMKDKQKNSWFYALFMVPCVWNKMIRHKLVKENNLQFQNVVLGEDVIFLAEVAALKPRYNLINSYVYFYWNHNSGEQQSLTHQYDAIHYMAHIYCREELLKICWEKAKIQDSYEYVYNDMLTYPIELLFRIEEFHEKEKAFNILKKHLQGYDWTDELERFEYLLGMSYEMFIQSSARTYFATTKMFNYSEKVLKQYEAGMLGFRYILKYAKAWAKYKVRRLRLGHKK